MNKQTSLTALMCLLVASAFAQVAQYSYISDRRFTSPDQLFGYDFKPAMREEPGGEPTEITVGKYSFGITRKNLYVEGPEIQGVYSLNEINTTEYGFILKTMNARDPTIQGHLKVVVDEIGQVEGLVFKRSNNDKEVIYFLRVIPAEVARAESQFFTHKGQQKVEHLDSLWTGVEIRPFLRIFNNMGGIQQRILPSDSVSLRFYHVTTVEEKDNKVVALVSGKKDKKKGKPSTDAADTDERLTASTAPMTMTLAAPAPNPEAAPGPAIRKTAEGETVDAMHRLGLDSVAVAAPDRAPNLGTLASLPLNLPADLPVDSSKLKITTTFYVDLNSFMRFDNGTSEMQHRTYTVNAAAERINTNARPGGDRYQWELDLNKQPAAYVYLDEKLNVNSIEIDGQKFYMRGQ